MANIPKRPLNFERYVRSDEAKELLAWETLGLWDRIFGWKDRRISAELQSQRNARPSQSKKSRR